MIACHNTRGSLFGEVFEGDAKYVAVIIQNQIIGISALSATFVWPWDGSTRIVGLGMTEICAVTAMRGG
jgi:hypothetical protein